MWRPCRAAGRGKEKGQIEVRWLCILAIPVVLSGCVMPAAVSVASLAVDTSSYMVTHEPDGGDLDLELASGGDPWAGVGYAQLAHRAHEARTGQRHYLAAGMIEPAL
jgi:hypothetical protein